MPMGISPAPEVFQRKLSQALEGLQGIYVIADDILITGEDGCEILRQLTHKDNMWDWSEAHEQAFTRLKDAITRAPLLKYYNPEESLTLQCDASETGFGAALLQKGGCQLLTEAAALIH
ncbi:hypothetical protein QQF64_026044 [Cirrhinus molitorella]|uniref:Reverse transcriptase/retrotransposon-derived protein RNase H-like domain-containing protein n=1 Tax=Cirrhinus molitorella TaxID=172907 RepID=A0ABR3NQR8_9TELE